MCGFDQKDNQQIPMDFGSLRAHVNNVSFRISTIKNWDNVRKNPYQTFTYESRIIDNNNNNDIIVVSDTHALSVEQKASTMSMPIYDLLYNSLMSKNSSKGRQQRSSLHNYQYYFVIAAIATAIAGIVHLYVPFSHPVMPKLSPITVFFIGSGIAQIFWILPMIKRWGRSWYYIGIAGNVGFIILYVITRFPGNPVVGRGGDVAAMDMVCETAT
ncbi:MAG: hypothetical protein WCC17_05075 [Candidatus Nitrosopolaris sp.]